MSLIVLGFTGVGRCYSAEVIGDESLHLYFSIDSSTLEATVGTNSSDRHNAQFMPPIGDAWWNNGCPNLWEEVTIPEQISYNGKTYTVTAIGQYAFSRTTDIKRINLPSTIRSFGVYAFSYCTNLESINMPESLTAIGNNAFELCRKITYVKLPSGVTEIGAYAFSDCVGLTEINIPGTCKSIGNEAFKACSSLTSLTVEDGPTILSLGYTFDKPLDYQGQDVAKFRGQFGDTNIRHLYWGRNFTYPSSSSSPLPPFMSISNYCKNSSGYQGKAGLIFDDVTLGEMLTDIPDNMFENCSIYNELILPSNLKTIGDNAFNKSSGVLDQAIIKFPASLTSIGLDAFYGCSKLHIIECESPNPPVMTVDVYHNPFRDCTVVVKVPKGAGSTYREDASWSNFTIIDEADEAITVNVKTPGTLYSRLLAKGEQLDDVRRIILTGSLNDDDMTFLKEMSALYDLDMYDTDVVEIPDKMMQSHGSLMFIRLPKTVRRIGSSAFGDCAVLSSKLDFPESCKEIGSSAFSNTLVDIANLPESVKIGDSAFWLCKNIRSIFVTGDGATIGRQAFGLSGVNKVVIGDEVESIGNRAFYSSNINELTLQGHIGAILSEAFDHITSLNRINFNCRVDRIESKWISLSSNQKIDIHIDDISLWCGLKFPDYTKHIAALSWDHPMMYVKDFYIESAVDGEISLSGDLETIENGTFLNATSIKKVIIEKGITSIGDYAFSNSGVENVFIPSTVTKIGNNAFTNCTDLKSLDLPESLSSIGEEALMGCSNLREIHAYWKDPFTIGTDAVKDISSSCIMYVPIGTAAKYRAAGWNVANMKEMGFISINVSGPGTVKFDTESLFDIHKTYDFAPFSSFEVSILPNDNCIISEVRLNNVDVTSDITCNKLIFEDPDTDYILEVKFSEPSVEPQSISLNVSEIIDFPGSTCQLSATIMPENTTDKSVIWLSSDENIATVDGNGLVSLHSVGKTFITASCQNVSTVCEVTVNAIPVKSIHLNKKEISEIVGSKIMLTAVIFPVDATNKEVVWTSSDEKVAVVSQDGLVEIISTGFATITATADGVSATCIIDGLSVIGSIYLDEDPYVKLYTLGGIEVKNPRAGIYIMYKDGKYTKVYISESRL